MANTYTPNLTLALPGIGDFNWSEEINGNFTTLDSIFSVEHNPDGTHSVLFSGSNTFSAIHGNPTLSIDATVLTFSGTTSYFYGSTVNVESSFYFNTLPFFNNGIQINGVFFDGTDIATLSALASTVSGSSGASLIGLNDEFIHGSSTDLMGILHDFDAALSAGGVPSHNYLTGLGADDHTQYLLSSGARALTGNWNVGAYAITMSSGTVTGNLNINNLVFNSTTISGEALVSITDGSNADLYHTHNFSAVMYHTDLLDMPDASGTVSDHDARYYTKTEVGSVASGTSGAALIGVYDELINSSSGSVQGVLADFDTTLFDLSADIGLIEGNYLPIDGSIPLSGTLTITESIIISGTEFTGADVGTLVGGGNADSLHTHLSTGATKINYTFSMSSTFAQNQYMSVDDVASSNVGYGITNSGTITEMMVVLDEVPSSSTDFVLYVNDSSSVLASGIITVSGSRIAMANANIVIGPGQYITAYVSGGPVSRPVFSVLLTTDSAEVSIGHSSLVDMPDFSGINTDHDVRYYTKTELGAGSLDSRYYTESELLAGALDSRYYTEAEIVYISGTLTPIVGAESISFTSVNDLGKLKLGSTTGLVTSLYPYLGVGDYKTFSITPASGVQFDFDYAGDFYAYRDIIAGLDGDFRATLTKGLYLGLSNDEAQNYIYANDEGLVLQTSGTPILGSDLLALVSGTDATGMHTHGDYILRAGDSIVEPIPGDAYTNRFRFDVLASGAPAPGVYNTIAVGGENDGSVLNLYPAGTLAANVFIEGKHSGDSLSTTPLLIKAGFNGDSEFVTAGLVVLTSGVAYGQAIFGNALTGFGISGDGEVGLSVDGSYNVTGIQVFNGPDGIGILLDEKSTNNSYLHIEGSSPNYTFGIVEAGDGLGKLNPAIIFSETAGIKLLLGSSVVGANSAFPLIYTLDEVTAGYLRIVHDWGVTTDFTGYGDILPYRNFEVLLGNKLILDRDAPLGTANSISADANGLVLETNSNVVVGSGLVTLTDGSNADLLHTHTILPFIDTTATTTVSGGGYNAFGSITIPGYTFSTSNQVLRFTYFINRDSGSGNATFNFNYGGATIVSVSGSNIETNKPFKGQVYLYNTGTYDSQGAYTNGFLYSNSVYGTHTWDSTTSSACDLEIVLDNPSDVYSCKFFMCERLK